LFKEFISIQKLAILKADEDGFEKGLVKGIREGLEQGLEQGMEQGLEQGLAEGMKKEKIYIAKNLLAANVEVATIILSTGLSEEEIKAL